LERPAIESIRLALNQNQLLGNARFYAKIEKMTGSRRAARPRLDDDAGTASSEGQAALAL